MLNRVGTIRRLTPPATEPVTLAEAKSHLRLETEFTADDTYISRLISSARDHAETYCGRAWASADFIWTVQLLKLKVFGNDQYIFDWPYPYASSINEIEYLDSDDVAQIISASDITLDLDRQRVTIPDSITGHDWGIRFTAGPDLGTSLDEMMPEAIKQAIYLLVGDAYDNRQALVLGVSIADNPAVKSLLDDYRISWGG